MLESGLPELSTVVVIAGIIAFGIIMKPKAGSDFGNIALIAAGIGMLVFASTCFKDIPLVGMVFLMPGDNIMNARMADPALRFVLFLAGGAFAAIGVFLQIRLCFDAPPEESSPNAASGNPGNSRGADLGGIREAKELLDAGAISDEEFIRIKAGFIK